ncbi:MULTISPECIES: class A sortase [Enterococcaceae]|uniref:class A sortase n=1 Tax=Enterococcaceae TaxID=81852 RepID=UPI000E4F2724|nr:MULTISPECIES: class A sortase [Enterococcaceae]MCI0131130.1 class A sortase [Vagococcus sp. CY53-2]RGI29738.1 class A sortase [Melissococcus sp. OM08-11BH]UNM89648.1 class A sortase [Vagococcus sp. CY52-2]
MKKGANIISNKNDSSQKKRSTKHQTKKKSIGQRFKHFFFNLIMIILFLVGIALIFNNQIKNYLVKENTAQYQVNKITRDDVVKNEQKEATFDFDQVESLDFNTVTKSRGRDVGDVVGGIAIPSVDLNLPILKGVSNYVISVGAGTMKPDQKMGFGNYALASHYMYDPTLLFAPLVRVELGSSIYLTDLEYIYEYKVTMKEYVEPTRVDVIEDVPEKRQVTLVTCDTSGEHRLILQGELVKKVNGKKAPKDMRDAFELAQNNYY